ncbi:MAG: DUF4430 domain-containing protein [Oscillospiraceae bacterium]|nr:DUF4430 domain-containing protein [Oscillospiraceae bacterium]
MEKPKNNAGRIILGAAALCVLAAVFLFAWQTLRPKPMEGAKTIRIEVIVNEKTDSTWTINTDAEYLRQALDEKDLIKGDESVYGLMVTSVNGIAADSGKMEWWSFTKDGEFLMTGVDDTPIYDGDKYEITLTVGYDDW